MSVRKVRLGRRGVVGGLEGLRRVGRFVRRAGGLGGGDGFGGIAGVRMGFFGWLRRRWEICGYGSYIAPLVDIEPSRCSTCG